MAGGSGQDDEGELRGGGARPGATRRSNPGRATRMLEALDVVDGNKVLKVGVGTGYNAALPSTNTLMAN
ncbi:hypothetical protein [Streptomyces niveus]|uniref:hypothetical protein n=1 Tax=Streptomyces niveus TaxID=193462 RepID=UPI003435F965